jgi:hypothetical protein
VRGSGGGEEERSFELFVAALAGQVVVGTDRQVQLGEGFVAGIDAAQRAVPCEFVEHLPQPGLGVD